MTARRSSWFPLLLGGALLAAPPPQDEIEARARAVFEKNCTSCHSTHAKTSGFAITTREALLAGGNRGPAVLPGRANESLLIQAVRQAGSLKMPPGNKLAADSIASLEEWVNYGAPWNGVARSSARTASNTHWAFQPVKEPRVPETKSGQVRNAIDSFVLARLEAERLKPSPEADRRVLIRRLSLDLIGLPPTWEEVEDYVADPRPDSYERLVDRLLASPHYGERWGRHWLDVARYADTDGYTRDNARQIWMYRDWVIQALNRDLPFDQFLIEQIAGDLLPDATRDQIVATGFHRNTHINLEGGVDFEQYRVEAVVDRTSTTGRALLGLTLGCARCHDHKYDPVTQREFYQLYAFFNSIEELSGEWSDKEGRRRAYDPVLEFGTPGQYAHREAVRSQVAALQKEMEAFETALDDRFADWEKRISPAEQARLSTETLAALRTPLNERTPAQRKILRELSRRLDEGYQQRLAGIKAMQQMEPQILHTLVMRDLPKPRITNVLIGGDFTSKGVAVQPGTPAFLPPMSAQHQPATRLDLARWLVDPANPLTPRVMVNRVWQHYFGRGIVATEDDFGLRGDPPSHPELLDWLAAQLVSKNWSLKALHKLIVTSATYRQSSAAREDLKKIDPENRLLARQSRLRLESEIIRDSGLAVSGLLQSKIGGPSVFPPQPEAGGPASEGAAWIADQGENRYRRGLYTTMRRGSPHPVMMTFDQPDAGTSCTRRSRSNTPLQALALLNDEAFHQFAQGLARRLVDRRMDQGERLRYGFQLCLGRAPQAGEQELLQAFFDRQFDRFQTHPDEAKQIAGELTRADPALLAAWIGTARVLLNLDEFYTRE